MTPISTRYATAVLALMLLTLVPVTAHYIIGLENEDCRDPDALRRLAINGAVDVFEWTDHHNYAVKQFTRGTAAGSRFLWVRSLVPQPFYGERPFMTPGYFSDGPSELEQVQVGDVELPIRVWRRDFPTDTYVTAIMTIYRGKPVEGTFWPSLEGAIDTLLHGPRPVNFIGLAGGGRNSLVNADLLREAMVEWITGIWPHYLAVCE